MSGRRIGAFEGFDFTEFWDEAEYSQKYTEPAPSDALVAEVERELGFRLPDAYVELAHVRNGGMPVRSCFPMVEPTGWADDHIAISGIYAIGRTARYSLLGDVGALFMREEWGYPDWGVGIADTPSAGHEMVMLDYRVCGPTGEPAVVHVDQELDYTVTFVAPDFTTFIRGLVSEEAYDNSEEVRAAALATVQYGTLSPIVRRALDVATKDLPDGEELLRVLGERIVEAKGFFALHADEDSWLMYDALFWLYSRLATASSFSDYFDRPEGQTNYGRPCHVMMMRSSFVADPYEFHTGGYAEGFVHDWWNARIAHEQIVPVAGGFGFSETFAAQIPSRLRAARGRLS